MAFTGNGRRLTGRDSKFYGATLGVEVTGNGSLAMPVGLHIVTAVAVASGYPDPTTGEGITAGRLIRIRTGDTITPAVGDKYVPLTLTQRCDIVSWSGTMTKAEIDVTTGCDDFSTFEPGLTDFSLSATGMTTIGTTTGPAGWLSQFIDIIEQDGDTSYDVKESSSEILFGWFVVNSNTNKGDEIGIFCPINIYSTSLGGDLGSAQSFETSIRLGSYTVGTTAILPALYRFAL